MRKYNDLSLNDIIPPIFFKIRESYSRKKNKARYKNNPLRPCHISELFINHEGDIYPCCLVWGRKDMKIGNLNDNNIINKIEYFDGVCSCERFRLRKAFPTEIKKFEVFNIEFSSVCQANCAMCCQKSYANTDRYDSQNFEQLAKLIDILQPSRLSVQGGEILVQKKTIQWLEKMKEKYFDVKISLITNGNVGLDMIQKVEYLFQKGVLFSFVGFQPETYFRIMDIKIEKTIQFIEELVKRKKVENIWLKYLTTPINFHEANLFLKWAIEISPAVCIFQESNINNYINFKTFDNYWNTIIERTSNEIKKTIIANKTKIESNNLKIQFDLGCLKLFQIDNKFIDENNLNDIVSYYKGGVV